MWFYPILLLLLVLALVGVIFLGGVYTLVLVPLAVIGIGSAVAYALWTRSMAGRSGAETDADHTSQEPLPHHRERPPSRVPTTPERLVDARREQQ